MMTTRVVFLLVPKLHLLDLAGPAQVFSTANDLGYGYALSYVAEVDAGRLQKFRPRAGANPAYLIGKPVYSAWK